MFAQMIRKISCLLLLCEMALPLPAFSQVQLVTEQEARADLEDAPLTPRSAVTVPDAPRIEIISPEMSAAVTSPARVELRFKAKAPASVKPETFKALYGVFRVDITNRLMQVAKVTADGLTVEGAALPAGSHRIVLEVQDSLGRMGSQLLSVTIQ